jgi:hypothetical protein
LAWPTEDNVVIRQLNIYKKGSHYLGCACIGVLLNWPREDNVVIRQLKIKKMEGSNYLGFESIGILD